MHAPVEIDVEDVDEFIPTVRVCIAADGGEEGRDVDVGADDVVKNPFHAEVGYAFEAVLEGVFACDGDGVCGS